MILEGFSNFNSSTILWSHSWFLELPEQATDQIRFFSIFFQTSFFTPSSAESGQNNGDFQVLPELSLCQFIIAVWNVSLASVSKWEQLINPRIRLGVTDLLCSRADNWESPQGLWYVNKKFGLMDYQPHAVFIKLWLLGSLRAQEERGSLRDTETVEKGQRHRK